MIRHLLDVNLLLALLWPRHESHQAAHAWFAESGHRAWATNPITQLGALRLLTNPAVTQGAVNATTALDVLSEATSHPGHEFWPLDGALPGALKSFAHRIRGHQQWTDSLLLWHAARRDGVLVTFDTGVKALAVSELKSRVLLLKSR
jgi:toxin-antitoxin system PIN domain toxin